MLSDTLFEAIENARKASAEVRRYIADPRFGYWSDDDLKAKAEGIATQLDRAVAEMTPVLVMLDTPPAGATQ
jgi:hypothetical protein